MSKIEKYCNSWKSESRKEAIKQSKDYTKKKSNKSCYHEVERMITKGGVREKSVILRLCKVLQKVEN